MNTIRCAECGYCSEMTRIVGRESYERTSGGPGYIETCTFAADERAAGRPMPEDEDCPHFKAALKAVEQRMWP